MIDRWKRRIATLRWLIGTVVAFSILLGLAGLLLWRWGLLKEDPNGDSTRLIAAVLILVGTVVTGAITFIGTLLTVELRRQSEARLRMETAIRGVSLLSAPGTLHAPKAQKAGALFALVELGQIRFSLACLDGLWKEIDPSSAVWVIEQALHLGTADDQSYAALMLNRNAHTLRPTPDNLNWPQGLIDRWPVEMDLAARMYVLWAIGNAYAAHDYGSWKNRDLYKPISLLYRALTNDPDAPVRGDAAELLYEFLDMPMAVKLTSISSSAGSISIDEAQARVASEIETGLRASNEGREVVDTVRKWLGKVVPTQNEPEHAFNDNP